MNDSKCNKIGTSKSREKPLELVQLSEEGFDLWPLVTSCFELRDSPFLKENLFELRTPDK